MNLLLIVVPILFVLWGVGLLWYSIFRRPRLKPAFTSIIVDYIDTKVHHLPLHIQIVEFDKILDKVLKELGYHGTLAVKLQKYGKRFPVPQSVWNAHRERNKFVHDLGYSLPHKQLQSHVDSLEQQVYLMLKRGQ